MCNYIKVIIIIIILSIMACILLLLLADNACHLIAVIINEGIACIYFE